MKYQVGGMTSLLHQLGFSYKKAKGVPGKSDPLQQESFLKCYHQIKNRGQVYFSDSSHPMLGPVLSSGWIKTGEDFQVKTNSGRQRAHVNGAIELKSLEVISRTSNTVNQQSMRELLRAIRRKNPEEKHLYLILDNASYNRSKKVKELAKDLGIKLIYLPPYSPHLNPIERLWKFLKKKVMANRSFEDLKSFKQEISKFLRGIRQYKDELSTLITDNFQVINP